jgi:hypothetical protein
MKKLLIALLMASSIAHAEQWLEMPNAAGGKILLLQATCSDSKGRMVIATTPEGINVHGCWWYFADMVHVLWKNGESSSFPSQSFALKEKQ